MEEEEGGAQPGGWMRLWLGTRAADGRAHGGRTRPPHERLRSLLQELASVWPWGLHGARAPNDTCAAVRGSQRLGGRTRQLGAVEAANALQTTQSKRAAAYRR
jgi:hypothetical protein